MEVANCKNCKCWNEEKGICEMTGLPKSAYGNCEMGELEDRGPLNSRVFEFKCDYRVVERCESYSIDI